MTTAITYVGHGTVLIETAGARVLTDPLLRRWAAPLRRYTPLPDPGTYERLDAVLLSHLHIDHVDIASLRLLDRDVTVLTPPNGTSTVRRLHFSDVREVSPEDEEVVGKARVVATPARHVVRRSPLAPVTDGLGFIVKGDASIYYAGDTGPFPEMVELGVGLDVALLPISGWGPTLDADEHLTPLAAARCLTALRPALAIPVHWGTYYPPAASRFWRKDRQGPARAFARYAQRLAPDVEVRILQPGERIELGARAGRSV